MSLLQRLDKKYELYYFDKEKDFEKEVVKYSTQVFGGDCLYFDIKKRLKDRTRIFSIPDGYMLVLSDPDHPKLFIIEIELAEHDPFQHIGTQLMRFGISFGSGSRNLKQILVNEINSNSQFLDYVNRVISKSRFRNINELVDCAVFDEPYGIVIIVDQIRDELELVVKELSRPIEIIEFETYIDTEDPTNIIHRFTPMQEEVRTASKILKLLPPQLDTIVCPAYEEGFKKVFLGEDRWYAVRMSPAMLLHIKHLAVYRTSPVSAITMHAKVKQIKLYKDTRKYELLLYDKEKIGPLKLVNNGKVKPLRGPRYTTLKKLKAARTLDEAFF